jgi:hypothetical protein
LGILPERRVLTPDEAQPHASRRGQRSLSQRFLFMKTVARSFVAGLPLRPHRGLGILPEMRVLTHVRRSAQRNAAATAASFLSGFFL